MHVKRRAFLDFKRPYSKTIAMTKERRIITEEPEELLHRYGDEIIQSENYQKLKGYPHHKYSTTYAHSILVTLKALEIAKEKKRKVDVKALVQACLLHDYYLYNHRNQERILFHLLRHPRIAAKNAVRDFQVSKHVYRIIRDHMWPLTALYIPTSREGWILMRADKRVSYKERFPKKENK